jgi:hypothetical protein
MFGAAMNHKIKIALFFDGRKSVAQSFCFFGRACNVDLSAIGVEEMPETTACVVQMVVVLVASGRGGLSARGPDQGRRC